jgi:VanZ family protein
VNARDDPAGRVYGAAASATAPPMLYPLFRFSFWAALLVCFILAVIPPTDVGPSDKLQHVFAFAVLTGLALAAHRPARPLILFASMGAFGGMIEIAQGLSFVGRDADLMDWLVDMAAVASVLAAHAMIRPLLRGASAAG